jgi:hypothetical protein
MKNPFQKSHIPLNLSIEMDMWTYRMLRAVNELIFSGIEPESWLSDKSLQNEYTDLNSDSLELS